MITTLNNGQIIFIISAIIFVLTVLYARTRDVTAEELSNRELFTWGAFFFGSSFGMIHGAITAIFYL